MNRYHQEILEEIKKHAGRGTSQSGNPNYLGGTHHFYSISVPFKREITRNWVRNHKDISLEELAALLDSLYKGGSFEEKTIASLILESYPKLKSQISPELVNNWLDYLEGWAEVDGLCWSVFSARDFLSNWETWQELIKNLSHDQNINKHRAALVLLTRVVEELSDERLGDLAFEVIERLKNEKEILVTKAISWLLRDLVKTHRSRVEKYLAENRQSLPKIALRETLTKLKIGKKR